MATNDHRSQLGAWTDKKPVHVSPDRIFKPFFNNLKLNSANFSLVWQAEEMRMPEGILANLEDYFRKYLASHRATTVLQSPSTPAKDYTFSNIQSDAMLDSGIEEGPDLRTQGRHEIRCTETQLPDKEQSLYKHALLCAQFPVLSRDPVKPSSSLPQPPSPFSLSSLAFSSPPISPGILPHSYSSGGGNSSDEGENLVQEEMLCSLVRVAFRLTEDSHIEFDKAITQALGGKPPAKILVEELLGRLFLIENRIHPTYHEEAFHVVEEDETNKHRLQSISHDLWQQEERMLVGSFISQFWSGHLPAPNSHLCRPKYWKDMQRMYKDLLIKLLRHDQQVDGASNRRVILHSSSRRLLKEFALRYGVSDIYQRIVLLEYLSEEENFELDRGYLKTTLNSITRLRALMLPEGGQCFTLESELDLAIKVLCQVQARCESKLNGMLQKSLSSHIVSILLTLLSEASQLLVDLGVDNQVSLTDRIVACINKCFHDWFYHHRLRLTTELHLNSYSAPVSAELISKLVIWIQDEVLDCQQKYFAVFERYSVDVSSVACHTLYKKLMVDVRQLHDLIQNITEEEHSHVGSTADLITLARKLDKLSHDWSNIITPSQETWRFLFIRLAHGWLKQIRKDLHGLIRYCVEEDDFSGMEVPIPSEGSLPVHQKTLPTSSKFSPSFGSAFRSISPPGSRGCSLVCMIQPASEDMGDPFLVEGWQNSYWRSQHMTDSSRLERQTPDENSNRVFGSPDQLKIAAGLGESNEQLNFQSSSLIFPNHRLKEAAVGGEGEETDQVGDESGSFATASYNHSSGYGTSAHTKTPVVSSFTSSFLSSVSQSQILVESCNREELSLIKAPFSGSVFDFLTMMSCTSQFLKELCVVLLPESRDLLAAGNFEALRERLEIQRAQYMMGQVDETHFDTEEAELSNGVAETLEEILLRSPKEVLETLMPLYAVSLLAMDLCSTTESVAKELISEKVLDFVNEMFACQSLPRCRHQRKPVTSCNAYVNRKGKFIKDNFEPIVPEMCVRINNVETLKSSRKWLFQDCPQVHPFLSRSLRSEDEDGGGIETVKLEEIHSAQVKILAYKVNLLLCQTMKVLLSVNTRNIRDNMAPYFTCLHNHLMVVSSWLYPASYHLFCTCLWEMIMQDISDTVKNIPQLVKQSELLAGRMLNFMAKLLEEFTQEPYGKLDTEQCLILGRPLLKGLELYTLPTSTIITTYHKILAQNWSSGYLDSSSGFLSQTLLDFLSTNLHQQRKCFPVSHLARALQTYKEELCEENEQSQSRNCPKEEWISGVVNEMIERSLLHPVRGGQSNCSTGTRSSPSQLYSEESEEYVFPDVTVHSMLEPQSDYVDSSDAGCSPPKLPPIPDVRTILSHLKKETTDENDGEDEVGGENCIKSGEQMLDQRERSFNEGHLCDVSGRTDTDAFNVEEQQSKSGNEATGGPSSHREDAEDSKTVCQGVVKSGGGDAGHYRVEINDADGCHKGDHSIVREQQDGPITDQETDQQPTAKLGRYFDDDQPAVRPKQRTAPTFVQKREFPSGYQQEETEGQSSKVNFKQGENRGSNPEGDTDEQNSDINHPDLPTSSTSGDFNSLSDVFTELEEKSDFYRLSLPLHMQSDGLQLNGLGEGMSNIDILLTILKSRRRYDRGAREFLRGFRQVQRNPFLFCC